MSIALSETRTSYFSVRAYRGWIVTSLIYIALGFAVLCPIVAIFSEAFFKGHGLRLATVIGVFSSDTVLYAIRDTLWLSVLSIGMASVIGITLAWLVARTNMPFKRIMDPLNMIPFYLSTVVGALSWQVIAAPRTGLLNDLFRPLFGHAIFNIYSIGGMAFVLGIYYAPFIYIFTLGSLQSMDASLEEAARMSGSSNLQTALRITLPLSGPAILSACILVFISCMGTFGVPLLLGVPGHVQTLSTMIYASINDYPADYTTAALLGLTLFVLTVGLTLLQVRVLKGRRFATVTGKGYRPRIIDLKKWRWLGFAANAFYLVLVLLPFVALGLVSLQNAWTGAFQWNRFTLDNYYQVIFVNQTAQRGMVNSTIIATIGATLAVTLCLGIALVVQRTRLPGRKAITAIAMLPITVPGIVLGVGFLFVFVVTPLYGTIWVIMLAYIIHYLPVGVKNIDSLVQSLSRELDESARVSGASWRQAVTRIIVPLAAPGLLSVWILLFVIFIREVSASMMLFTYGTETLSIALIRIMQYAPYGVAGAFGVLQTVILLLCVMLLRLIPTSQRA